MATDLELLIDFYQWEKQRLLLTIEDNKRDHDFIAVDNNYKELGYVQRELDCLLRLKDRNYHKIKRLEWEIDQYSNKRNHHLYNDEFTSKMVNQFKEELEKIKKQGPSSSSLDTQFIDEALFSIVTGEIEGFTLLLDVKMDSKIELVRNGENQLLLRIGVESKNDAKYLKKYGLLGDVGLSYDDNLNSLVKLFEIGPHKNVLPIKEAISRIVIGSKGFLWEEGTIYLKLITK